MEKISIMQVDKVGLLIGEVAEKIVEKGVSKVSIKKPCVITMGDKGFRIDKILGNVEEMSMRLDNVIWSGELKDSLLERKYKDEWSSILKI
jgi:CO dehydrogenase/acetyl-CoA synthase alpha subunit